MDDEQFFEIFRQIKNVLYEDDFKNAQTDFIIY